MAKKRLYGGETAKAVDNFPVSGERVPVSVIHWIARIKGAAAVVNADLGLLDPKLAKAISEAAAVVAAGTHDDQFPLDVFQTGSGTSTNMNVNEVISALTGGRAHPNDHVNLGQSSNDTAPSRRSSLCISATSRTAICPRVLRASEYAPASVWLPNRTCTPNARPWRIRRSNSRAADCDSASSSTKNSWNSSITSNTRGNG